MATALGIDNAWTLLGVSGCAFVFGTITLEYYRGVKVRRAGTREGYPQAVAGLVTGNRRRYGGYIVHIAMLLIALGVIGANLHQKEQAVTLAKGESTTIGDYTLVYKNFREYRTEDSTIDEAELDILKDGKKIGVARPKRQTIDNQESQPTSRISIRSTPKEDLYVLLAAWDDTVATFTIFVNPLVMWLWIGGGVFLFGTVIAIWPDRQPARALATSSPSKAATSNA